METQVMLAEGPMSALMVVRSAAGSAKPPMPLMALRPIATRLPRKDGVV